MGKNTELLAGQQFHTHARDRLRAGRERISGPATGSLSEIVANSTDGLIFILDGDLKTIPEAKETHNTFGLSEGEKASIESDINAKRPIGVGLSTEAYEKFLRAIFPDKEPNFPYLADYDDSCTVVSQLSALYGRTVRLPIKDEAIQSLRVNNHLTGYRNAVSGYISGANDLGVAYLSGGAIGGQAPYVCRYYDGRSNSSMNDYRIGRSVIPVFG